MIFSPWLRSLNRKGIAREILEGAADAGLVHAVSNWQQDADTICNCCACSCLFFESYHVLKHEKSHDFSNYRLKITSETCQACGLCVQRCPVQALRLKETPLAQNDRGKVAALNPDQCLGCGVCVHKCPTRSLILESRTEIQDPPKDMRGVDEALDHGSKTGESTGLKFKRIEVYKIDCSPFWGWVSRSEINRSSTPHLMDPGAKEPKKTLSASEMLIDLGAGSAAEVNGLGVRVGDPIVFQKQLSTLANACLAARGMDNRAGCAVLIKVLEALEKVNNKPTIHYVFTVQEEYGLRGAAAAGYTLEPDLSLVVDTASAPDFPGVPPVYQGQFRLGQGPILRLVDNRMITSQKLGRWAWDLARDKKISLQRGVTGGSTDAAAVQLARKGLTVLPIGLPCRYTHSLVETVSIQDLKSAVSLILEMMVHLPSKIFTEKGGGPKAVKH